MIHGGHYFIDGGLQIDGTEVGTVSHSQVQEVCKQLKESGVGDVVVCGIHSPIDSIFHQERKCKEILLQELGSVNVVCSADSEFHAQILSHAWLTRVSWGNRDTRKRECGCTQCRNSKICRRCV